MTSIILSTPRLLLRPIHKKDLMDMHTLSSIAEVEKYNTLGIPANLSVTKSILKERIKDNKIVPFKNYTFAIEEKGTGKFIGMFGLFLGRPKQLRAEIWYKLHPDFWGKGLATEAVHGVLDYCFDELKLHRVEAGCAVENLGSIRVLEKVGMLREGMARKILPLDSGWSDGYSFGILSSDKRNR